MTIVASVPCVAVRQPVGIFYVGSIPASTLYSISKFDIRRMSSERGMDLFVGIQREVNPKRLVDLKRYITSKDATFPTAVVIAVDERCVAIKGGRPCYVLDLSPYDDEDDPSLSVSADQIATIIDGQHRIKAFEERGSDDDFEINVAIFIGADVATQAEIFSTVNLAQTKVSRSLVYDLFSYSVARSPEKTSHYAAVALDEDPQSPFFERIKRLGVVTRDAEGNVVRFGETLSQATFVTGLLPHITRDAFGDRELEKRGRAIQVTEDDFKRCVLRPFYARKDDPSVVNVMFNYFSAIRDVWEEAWRSTARGNMINRTNGYLGFMKFFGLAVREITQEPKIPTVGQFRDLFGRIDLRSADFNTENFPPGTSGSSKLFRVLRDSI